MNRNELGFAASEYVSEWLDVSQQNVACAVLLSEKPSMKREALHMVQQSAETATKAMARGVGMSHRAVVRSSHENLNLACTVLDKIAKERAYIAPLIGNLIEDNALKTLGWMLRATDKKRKTRETREFKASMQTASPSKVESILDVFDEIDAMMSTAAKTLTGKFMMEVSLLKREKNDEESLISQLVKIASDLWEDEHGEFDPEAVEATLILNFGKDLELITEVALREDLDADAVLAPMEWAIAMVKVFVIGGLAWPHQPSVRYPSEPHAPDDPKEAARQGKLGWKHYTDEIGVVLHVQKLSRSLLDAVETLSGFARYGREK